MSGVMCCISLKQYFIALPVSTHLILSQKNEVILSIWTIFSQLLEGQSQTLKGPKGVEFINNQPTSTMYLIKFEGLCAFLVDF